MCADLTNRVQRPAGAMVLALLLGWLSIGGFGNAVIWRSVSGAFDQSLPPQLAAFIAALQSPLWTILSLAYGVTALAAAIGIWQLRSWMSSAFLAWSVVVIATLVWLSYAMPLESSGGRVLAIVFFILFMAGLLAVLYRYVAKLPHRD